MRDRGRCRIGLDNCAVPCVETPKRLGYSAFRAVTEVQAPIVTRYRRVRPVLTAGRAKKGATRWEAQPGIK
jgi:hypothetical protein